MLAGWHIEKQKAACGIREGTNSGAPDVYLDRLERTLRSSIFHHSDKRTRCLGSYRSW
jgi:hypothetical protein